MAKEDALARIKSEFKLWGVRLETVEMNGGGHYELRWRATPDKEQRRFVIAATPSDWRAPANNAAHVRRLFKADGLTLKKDCEIRPKPNLLAKALAMPEPVEKDADQIRMLRAEVGDLTEMMFDMCTIITGLKEQLATQQAMMPSPQVVITPPAPPVEAKPSVRSINALEHVGRTWISTDALAASMGLKKSIAYSKLYYIMKTTKEIELSNGNWRKKPSFLMAAE